MRKLARSSFRQESPAGKQSGPGLQPPVPSSGPFVADQQIDDSYVSPKFSYRFAAVAGDGGSGQEPPPLRSPIQAKLEVGAVNDPLEHEADRLAEQVLRMPEPGPQATKLSASYPAVRRKCACGGSCEACQEEQKQSGTIKRKALAPGASGESSESLFAPPSVHEVLRSPGQPPDKQTRAYLEPRLGFDFSHVRVHADGKANQSARTIAAHAYTTGNHVVFGAAQYAPQTWAGRKLLLHELAHVIQQSSAGRVDLANQKKYAPLATNLTPTLVQRQGEGNASDDKHTRKEEIAGSLKSPGEIKRIGPPPVMSFQGFAIDHPELKKEHEQFLLELANGLQHVPAGALRLVIVGHADSTGSPAENQPLSVKRAMAVKKLLQPASRVELFAAGAGSLRPLDSNDTEEGRKHNRRVDVHFLPVMKVRPPSPVPQPIPVPPPVPPPVQQTTPPPQPVPTPTPPPVGKQTPVPTPQPQDKDQEDDDRSFCERNEQFCDWVGRGVGTGIAVGIGVGIGSELTEYWESLKGIRKVWEKIRGNDDDDDKEKDKDKENKDERPCVDESRTILPSDEIPATSFGPFLVGSFRMGLTFKEDDTGCRCRLGEYRQMTKGFAEHDEGTGVMKPSHPLGMQLSRTQEQEDLREGCRAVRLARQQTRKQRK
jgi:outer membrane protein OmpA-like peptidoglycan-associated protein